MDIVLKSITCDEHNLESYFPDLTDNFSLNLLLVIGSKNSPEGDYFTLFVCTPKWLECHTETYMFSSHTLIVKEYNLSLLKEIIQVKIDQCAREDWAATAQHLSLFFEWEFEDYHEE